MVNVRLIDITPDFYAFSHRADHQTELIISAHGWQNKIRRNGALLNAEQLRRVINHWRVDYDKLTLASCFSTFLPPSGLANRLTDVDFAVYRETLGCQLSRYMPDVIVMSFIGEVYSSVDNQHAWGLYRTLGRDGLEFMLKQLFLIKFNATVSENVRNPCRYVEFRNGQPFRQEFPTVRIHNNLYAQL